MARNLIVNADDFGYSPGVNRGIAESPGQRHADACPQPGGGLRAALAVPGVEVA